LKRTRRIEIVRYTRRLTLQLGDDNAGDGAEYSNAIDIFSMTQVDTPIASEQTNEVDGQAIDSAAPTSPCHRWFSLDWFKRE
jgi:hypothetical protein